MTTELCPVANETLLIADLATSHNRLRNKAALEEMTKYVASGGFWTEEYLREYALRNNIRQSPIIQISRFDDGWQMIHDGHHRIGATHMAGRTYLRADEFNITDWTYSSYLEICHENNWYTPFDPRTYCRKADFAAFKKLARERFLSGEKQEIIHEWILSNSDLYVEPRGVQNISELIEVCFP